MSIRKNNFVVGEFYHIYNRGNSKQEIFRDKQDYLYFIDLLYFYNTDQKLKLYNIKRSLSFSLYEIEIKDNLVSIGAYCLMPNHFHILITEKIDNGISKFMQKICTSYAMYYNNKYKRTGALFEGKFKAEHVNNDRHLKYLFSYIHLNPIKLIQKDWKEIGIINKKDAIDYLGKYQYSSYLDFIDNNRMESKILNIKSFPDYFFGKGLFLKQVFDWLSCKEEMS